MNRTSCVTKWTNLRKKTTGLIYTVKSGISPRSAVPGSFTIEAAVVVPLTMLILMAVVFLSLYVHDQVSMVAVTQYAALAEAEASLNGTFGFVSPQQNLSRQLLRSSNAGLSVGGDVNAVTAAASADFSVPLPMVDLLTGHGLRSIRVSVTDHAFSGRKKLLLYKSICDGVQDLTGRH